MVGPVSLSILPSPFPGLWFSYVDRDSRNLDDPFMRIGSYLKWYLTTFKPSVQITRFGGSSIQT